MAAIILTQTDTAADDGFNVGCSGATAGATPISREATEGGTAGTVEASPDSGGNALVRALVAFQSNTGEPNRTTWEAGDYVVRLNVTTAAGMGAQWQATYVCERTTGGSYNTVASLTGQTTDISTAGVKTHTVNRGTDFTPASAGSTVYIVLVFLSQEHGSTGWGFTPNQNIDTPIQQPTIERVPRRMVPRKLPESMSRGYFGN